MCFRVRTSAGAILVFSGLVAGMALAPAAAAVEDSFEGLVAAAMGRMDRGMMVAPSGDPDRDFATMMIPHHRGAIDMAEAELRYGHDQVLRRLAQGIIVEQQQEIVVMHQAIAALPTSTTIPTSHQVGSHPVIGMQPAAP